MSRPLAPRLPLLVLVAGLALPVQGADGPSLPWADPIGTSPTYGTARPSLPHAEPIGASRLHPPRRAYTVRERVPRQLRRPTRSCHRFRDNRGNVGIRCTTR